MHITPPYPFGVSGISADIVKQYRHLSEEELQKHRVLRRVADEKPGFPCRVTLVDAEIGESVFLLNFEHLPGLSPYRSVGPIFVRESATEIIRKQMKYRKYSGFQAVCYRLAPMMTKT
jgi:hypothetical protein